MLADYVRILGWLAERPEASLSEAPEPVRACVTPQPAQRATTAPYAAASTPEELKLAGIWQRLLDVERVGVDDDFFDLGGHSMLAAQLIDEIDRAFGAKIDLFELAVLRSVRQLASRLQDPGFGRKGKAVTLRTGDGPPLFCLHGTDNVFYFVELARAVKGGGSVYAFPAPDLDHELSSSSIVEIACYYAKEIQAIAPDGPYSLCGYSVGALISYEIATILQRSGKVVDKLILIDTSSPLLIEQMPVGKKLYLRWARNFEKLSNRFSLRHPRELFAAIWRVGRRQIAARIGSSSTADAVQGNLQLLEKIARQYRPQPFDGHVILFRSGQNPELDIEPAMGWDRLARGGVTVLRVDTDHLSIMRGSHVEKLARLAFPD